MSFGTIASISSFSLHNKISDFILFFDWFLSNQNMAHSGRPLTPSCVPGRSVVWSCWCCGGRAVVSSWGLTLRQSGLCHAKDDSYWCHFGSILGGLERRQERFILGPGETPRTMHFGAILDPSWEAGPPQGRFILGLGETPRTIHFGVILDPSWEAWAAPRKIHFGAWRNAKDDSFWCHCGSILGGPSRP